jgi:hypothetical protein
MYNWTGKIQFAPSSLSFMRLNILLILLITLLCVVSTVAQNAKENLLEKVDLTFYVEGIPTIESVGFNNPKSSWKIEYQLYLSDWNSLKKLGRCGVKDEGSSKEYCSPTVKQKLDKRIKKIAVLVSKGKFSRNRLSVESNTRIVETVNLTPQVIEIFNQASQIYENNPVFVFHVKTKVSTKNSAGKKLKGRYMTEGLHWLKIYKLDKSFDYWNIAKLSFGIRVVESRNGSLELQGGYTHFGVVNP